MRFAVRFDFRARSALNRSLGDHSDRRRLTAPMPPENVVTRLQSVAVGLELLADELEKVYGEAPLNLVYWRDEIIEVVEGLRADGSVAPSPSGSTP